MASQLHTSKNTPTTAHSSRYPQGVTSPQTSFQPRPFAVQAKEDTEDDQSTSDLQDQLGRAERFGHSLGRVQVEAGSTANLAAQAKSDETATQAPVQRLDMGGGGGGGGADGGLLSALMPMISQMLPAILPMLLGAL